MDMKKGMAVTLAACIALSPIATLAEKENGIDVQAPVTAIEDDIKANEFIEFKGKIEEITNSTGEQDQGGIYVLAKNDKDALSTYVDENLIILSKKSMDFVKKDKLEVGMEVSIFYHKDTPMALSYPPMLYPNVIVINDNEEYLGVMVSKFDEGLLNAEEDMVISPSEKTIIVDKDGKEFAKEELKNRDLIVFYDIVLKSYPGQTSPKKIVVMPEKEEKELNEFIIDAGMVKQIDDVKMIPLRLVGEALGYKVSWNQGTKSAELTRGPQWILVTIGQDNYNFAKMLIKLGTSPALIESKTYVPLVFIEEVLQANVDLLDNGGIKVSY